MNLYYLIKSIEKLIELYGIVCSNSYKSCYERGSVTAIPPMKIRQDKRPVPRPIKRHIAINVYVKKDG